MHSTILKAAASAFMLAGLTTGLAQQAEPLKIKLDTSYVFTRGDYGLPQDTDVSIFLLNPTVEVDQWRFQASIPYVRLDGPASIVGNTGAPTLVSRSTHGLGDLTLSAGHKLETESSGWSSDLSVKVKFPTADDAKGLGTGEMDTMVQMDAFKVGGKITPYATLGYQFLGSNASYPMKNGAYVTAGFAGQVSPGLTMGLAGNWRQPIVVGGKAGVEAMAFVQRKFSEQSRIQAFVLHGFTVASPNIAIGATLGFSF